MSVQTLRSYFETADQQRRALNALGNWFNPQELDIYEASLSAFDLSLSPDKAFPYFETIYDELKSPNWQVFRSPVPGAARWPPRQVFETIKREFAEFSWGGPVTLLNFPKGCTARTEAHEAHLASSLAKMQGIKQKNGYPHMTVSKFLHFYNPELFPIYDEKVIRREVFGCFRNDFQDFCRSANIPFDRAINDDTAAFLLYYMGWANHLLSFRHETFMQVFRDWLDEQSGTELRKRRFDTTTLYARAFEYTATGAAKKECGVNRQEPGRA
jgi:hypothetical protein